MSLYKFTATTGGIDTSVEPDAAFSYTDCLNEMNEAELRFSSISITIRAALVMGATLTITKDSTIVFYGVVDSLDYVDGGGLVVHSSGYEIWLAKEHGAYASSPWNSTASATVFAALIAESTHLTADTIAAGLSVDFRANPSDSLWNAINSLLKKTGQDLFIDYSNIADIEIGVSSHRGSSTSIGTMNGGTDFFNMRYTTTFPAGNYVIVYGKGDGTNQIKSTSAAGQDGASQAAYGVVNRIVTDKEIDSVTAANNLANKEVALSKDPQKVYTFQVKDLTWSIVAGDVLTLTSADVGLTDEDVRVTRVKRGYYGQNEYLELQVTNSAYGKLVRDTNRQIAELKKQLRDSASYMQGSTNHAEFPGRINGNSTYGLCVPFYIGSFYQDEASNLRINSLTVDYDVDPYSQQYGTATATANAPDVSGNSANANPSVSGTSATATPTATSGVSVWTANPQACSVYWAGGYTEENLVGSPVLYTSRGETLVSNYTGGDVTVHLHFEMPSGTTLSDSNYSLSTGSTKRFNSGESDPTNSAGWWWAYDNLDAGTNQIGVMENIYTHTHGTHDHADGSYNADSHPHADGTYGAASHDHSTITIGDSVGEAGSVNATGTNIYLEMWNTGTSTWDTKHSHLATGTTLAYNVDMSDSGTYPDAVGWWRIRITTNNATADLIQAIVKIKHHIDS